jgi:hypothetical protein
MAGGTAFRCPAHRSAALAGAGNTNDPLAAAYSGGTRTAGVYPPATRVNLERMPTR